jgi:hypothetical protein
MNQELFDDLTRGLATSRLSRRQVLKGLAGERDLGALRATIDARHRLGGSLALCSRTPLYSRLERLTWRGWEAGASAITLVE